MNIAFPLAELLSWWVSSSSRAELYLRLTLLNAPVVITCADT